MSTRDVTRIALRSAFVAALFVLFVLPLVFVVVGSFRVDSPLSAPGPDSWTLQNYTTLLRVIGESGSLVNSLLLAATSSIVCILIGGYLSFLIERTDYQRKALIQRVMLVSMVTLPLVVAMGYSLIGSRYNGIVNNIARALTGDDDLVLTDSRSFIWAIAVCAIIGTSKAYFMFSGVWGRVDRSLEEIALVSSYTRLRTFFRVTLPLLVPTLSGIFLITFIAEFQVFVVPYILDSDPAFLLNQIVDLVNSNPQPDYGLSSTIGVVTVGIVIVFAVVDYLLVKNRGFEVVTGSSTPPTPLALGGYSRAVTASVLVFLVIAVVVPIAGVVVSSFTVYPGVYSSFTLNAYEKVFNDRALVPAIANSIWLSLSAATIAVLISLIITVIRYRSKSAAFRSTVMIFTLLALALPGVVQAIGMLWAYASTPGLQRIYGTPYLVMLGLVVVAVPLLNQIFLGSFRQISIDLEDAAVVAGRSRAYAFVFVTLRQLLPTIAGLWFFTVVIVFGNVEIPLVLGAAGNPTLVQLIQLSFSSQDRSYSAALTALLLGFVLLLIGVFAIVTKITGQRSGRTSTLRNITMGV